jgi:hypothetical protein
MISPEQEATLLAAHHQLLETCEADLIPLIQLVKDTIPDHDSQEKKDWITHMGHLIDIWKHQEEGDKVPWPDVSTCLM